MEPKKTNAPHKKTWWVLQRHDEFSLEQSEKRPEHPELPGERLPAMFGPFSTREEAQKTLDKKYGRTLKGQSERNG